MYVRVCSVSSPTFSCEGETGSSLISQANFLGSISRLGHNWVTRLPGWSGGLLMPGQGPRREARLLSRRSQPPGRYLGGGREAEEERAPQLTWGPLFLISLPFIAPLLPESTVRQTSGLRR